MEPPKQVKQTAPPQKKVKDPDPDVETITIKEEKKTKKAAAPKQPQVIQDDDQHYTIR